MSVYNEGARSWLRSTIDQESLGVGCEMGGSPDVAEEGHPCRPIRHSLVNYQISNHSRAIEGVMFIGKR